MKPALLNALNQLSVEKFTVDQLTETYFRNTEALHASKKAARQFVYRNMKRLIEKGYLESVVVEQGWPHYALTTQYRKKYQSLALPTISDSPVIPTMVIHGVRQSLQDRLNRHKSEILTVMGETEEYDAICLAMPEMRADIQLLYNESRDRCSKLLGKVRALECVLANEAAK
jgi:hypothetical protein